MILPAQKERSQQRPLTMVNSIPSLNVVLLMVVLVSDILSDAFEVVESCTCKEGCNKCM
jgi:ATP-dependent helicase YprA (DUF1998 family)